MWEPVWTIAAPARQQSSMPHGTERCSPHDLSLYGKGHSHHFDLYDPHQVYGNTQQQDKGAANTTDDNRTATWLASNSAHQTSSSDPQHFAAAHTMPPSSTSVNMGGDCGLEMSKLGQFHFGMSDAPGEHVHSHATKEGQTDARYRDGSSFAEAGENRGETRPTSLSDVPLTIDPWATQGSRSWGSFGRMTTGGQHVYGLPASSSDASGAAGQGFSSDGNDDGCKMEQSSSNPLDMNNARQAQGSGGTMDKNGAHATHSFDTSEKHGDHDDDQEDDEGKEVHGDGGNTQRMGQHEGETGVSGLRDEHWFVTSDIILRATNGDRSQDVHYPLNPRVEDVMYSLQDPNAPTLPGHSAATTHHLQFYGYGPGQVPRNQIMPPPADQPGPGVLPYTSPSLESYFHIDPNKRPRRQDEKLRFPGDLYTPRWVRGEGTGREGWCSLCQTGGWMQLKTSQYWYHVRFTHGVNSNTGRIYDPPVQLRICDDSLGSTYGFCGECSEWVPICTPRRKRTFTAWFKHAHKCHRVQHVGQLSPVLTSSSGGLLSSPVPSFAATSSPYSGPVQPHNTTVINSFRAHPLFDPVGVSPTSMTAQTGAASHQSGGMYGSGGGGSVADAGSSGHGSMGHRNSIFQRASWPHMPANLLAPASDGLVPPSSMPNAFDHLNAVHAAASYASLFQNHTGHRRSTSEGWTMNG